MWPIQLAFPVFIVLLIFLSSKMALWVSKITQETPNDKKSSLGEKVRLLRLLWYGGNPNDNCYNEDGKPDAEKRQRLVVVSLLRYKRKQIFVLKLQWNVFCAGVVVDYDGSMLVKIPKHFITTSVASLICRVLLQRLVLAFRSRYILGLLLNPEIQLTPHSTLSWAPFVTPLFLLWPLWRYSAVCACWRFPSGFETEIEYEFFIWYLLHVHHIFYNLITLLIVQFRELFCFVLNSLLTDVSDLYSACLGCDSAVKCKFFCMGVCVLHA